ncbi:MAG: DegT/DnrJ/EryC1/StrS family aminotransferase [Candidatus Bipolaricaulia bacterium]
MKSDVKEQLAILEGEPVRKDPFPPWPQFDENEEKNLLQVLRSRNWGRHQGDQISQLEGRFTEMCEVEHALMVSSGSTALEIALRAAGVEAGDEVLVPPYTFMSTIMSVIVVSALPVFVDIDPETYCMDPSKIEERITPQTQAIVPVHLAGMPCDMGAIMEMASRHNLVVIEDACQAHFAEWNGRKVGGLADLGCFSFQSSKNVSAGEGGAIVGNDSAMIEACFHYHTCGRPQESGAKGELWYSHDHLGTNYRMTEFQAAILLAQLDRVEDQMEIRSKNAAYLSEQLSQTPGIEPLAVPDFVTAHAYHLYVFRYAAEAFKGLHRNTFVRALSAEGIPCSPGYPPLYEEAFVKKALESPAFRKIYGKSRLDGYFSGIHCPVNDKACREEAVWIPQFVLLGTHKDMDDVVESVLKIRKYGEALNG